MPSDTVQIITAIISLAGTVFAGFLTYLMARLRTDAEHRGVQQQLHAANVTTRVEEIQDALRRIEDNRASLALIRGILATHGHTFAANYRDIAAQLAANTNPAELHLVFQRHADNMVGLFQDTITKLAEIDVSEPRGKSDGGRAQSQYPSPPRSQS